MSPQGAHKVKVKVKVKFAYEQVTKVQGGSERCSSFLSSFSVLGGGRGSTPRPARFTPGKDPVPIV